MQKKKRNFYVRNHPSPPHAACRRGLAAAPLDVGRQEEREAHTGEGARNGNLGEADEENQSLIQVQNG